MSSATRIAQAVRAISEIVPLGALLGLAFLLATTVRALAEPSQGFVLHAAAKELPEIAFSDGEGQPLGLGDFRGRTVLLNVWATWCPPCVREMPTLDRLEAELGGLGFEVVALSIDRAGPEVVRRFYERTGVEHALRHACASLMIEQGWPVKKIEVALGHSSITMTMDTYGHLFTKAEDDVALVEKMELDLMAA